MFKSVTLLLLLGTFMVPLQANDLYPHLSDPNYRSDDPADRSFNAGIDRGQALPSLIDAYADARKSSRPVFPGKMSPGAATLPLPDLSKMSDRKLLEAIYLELYLSKNYRLLEHKMMSAGADPGVPFTYDMDIVPLKDDRRQ